MCTVSYLPKGKSAFILTSNRDEKSSRSKALFPSNRQIAEEQVVFPKDPDAGGSWIAASPSGKVVCLLNGAFLPFVAKPFYKKSRGVVLLDSLKYDSINDFYSDYGLTEVAPFTLISFFQNELHEFRWDGEQKFMKRLQADQPHLWSSVTLYDQEVMERRAGWFEQWLKRYPDPSLTEIRTFHHNGGDGDLENNFKMNRSGKLYTVSVTSIVKEKYSMQMIYEDLLHQEIHFETLTPKAQKTTKV